MTAVVIKIWRDNGERNKRPKGRFRLYLDEIGLDAFRAMVEERFGPLTPDPGSVFNAEPRSHYGIHPQKQEGLSFAGLHVPVGRLTAQDLHDLSSASMKYGSSEIRLEQCLAQAAPTAALHSPIPKIKPSRPPMNWIQN
jgi:ferredoxin-nitrite reductase